MTTTMRTGMRGALAAAMLAGGATAADAQQAALPFSAGETCVYRGSNVLGRIGTGTMAVEPADGGTVLLRFDFRGRVGPAGIEDRSRSWFDTAARGSRRWACTSNVTLLTTYSPLSSQVERTLVIVATTSMARASRLFAGSNRVMSPVAAGIATCGQALETARKDIMDAVCRVNSGAGVVVLTDMFGGTPSNLAISVMKPGKAEVIAGVNLPMLIRLESARKMMGVHAAVTAAREAGRKYISVASEILGEAAA